MTWVLVVVLAAGTIALKVAGPLITGGVQPPATLVRVIDLLTPALLTGLVVTSTFASGRELVVDARAAGVLVGLGLLLLRVPLVVALVAAAAAVALIRFLT
jgi:hypothetical protein